MPPGASSKALWQDLRRHLSVQLRIGGLRHRSRATIADLGDGVRAESGADLERHDQMSGKLVVILFWKVTKNSSKYQASLIRPRRRRSFPETIVQPPGVTDSLKGEKRYPW